MIGIAVLMITAIIIAGCSTTKPEGTDGAGTTGDGITIFKSSSCGCCGIYSQYMQKEGYNVNVQNVPDVSTVKERYNIPANLQSCHTTVVGDYFVEGHVPNEAVEKMMTEKPNIVGIAMPGMPSGSPGMAGQKTGTWIIYAVHGDGTYEEFMRM